VLSGLTIVSLGASVWFTAQGGTFAFYQLPARAWEFGIGGLAVLLPSSALKKLPSGWWAAVGWFGVLGILASAFFLVGDSRFPGWLALFPVMATIIALVAGAAQPHRGAGIVLDSEPLQTVGTLSYSWYLWHWPFLVFAAALFPHISMAGKTTAAALSLATAAAAHHLVENPIRFRPYLVKRPALSLCLAAVVTVCSVGAAALSMQLALRLADAPEMKTITAAVNDIARMPRQQCVTLGESPDVKTCVFGSPSSATNIVLFGDSHAIQWFNPLERIVESRGWKLTTIVKSGCPATDVRITGSEATSATACGLWRAEAIRRIVALRPSIVFIGNATHRDVSLEE
jgi:hypothetical protein